MEKKIEGGKSMIEMLGVLAIIGVLSIGGLDMITKARRNNQIAGLLGNISNLAGTIQQQRKYANEIKDSYDGNYILFLHQTGKISADMNYDSTSKALNTELNNTITAEIDDDNISVIKISGLDREICMKIASNNWGDRTNNKFLGLIVGNTANFSCVEDAETPCSAGTNSAFSGIEGYPMPVAKAATACLNSNSNVVSLAYKF